MGSSSNLWIILLITLLYHDSARALGTGLDMSVQSCGVADNCRAANLI